MSLPIAASTTASIRSTAVAIDPSLGGARLIGLATATPPGIIDRQTALAMAISLSTHVGGVPQSLATQQKVVRRLYHRGGVSTRASVLVNPDNPTGSAGQLLSEFYPPTTGPEDRGPTTWTRMRRFEIDAPPLAMRAVRRALADAGIDGSQITHLVTVTCTGFWAPGLDVTLIRQLSLPADCERVQVGFMGCHGAINGMRTAAAIAESNPRAVVLLVCVELCSLHYQYGFQTDRLVSGSLFADGAAAAVITGGNLPLSSAPDASPATDALPTRATGRIVATGSWLIGDTEDWMTWTIGDHGFEMTLSNRVPSIIRAQLRPFLERWLAGSGRTMDQIGGWCVHPGGPRILQSVQEACGLSDEKLVASRTVLREHGNMSSATMLFILERFRRAQLAGPYLMLGFGPGLEIEVALIDCENRPSDVG